MSSKLDIPVDKKIGFPVFAKKFNKFKFEISEEAILLNFIFKLFRNLAELVSNTEAEISIPTFFAKL